MKILLVEDDDEKCRILAEFVTTEFPGISIVTARSFNSGLRTIISQKDSFAAILLDMSMPNYDVSVDEPSGGTPESFAGEQLLAQMKLRGISVPTIVVTMFDKFGDEPNKLSLNQLIGNLKSNYHPIFRGLTYYNTAEDGWRTSLRNLISGVINSHD